MLPSPIISNSASGEIIGGLQTQFGTVDYASFQSVRVPFYSYNTYPVAGVSVLNFFGSIAGQPSITTQDTNIPKAGSFGQSHFLLKSIGMDIRIGNDPFSTFDGTDASTLASDMLLGFVNAGVLRFSIASRDFLLIPKPFQYLPPLSANIIATTAGITALTAPLSNVAGTLTSDTPIVTQTIERQNAFIVDPQIFIPAEQQFSVTLEFPTGQVPVISTGVVNDSTNPLKVGVWLDGVWLRPMQ